MIYRKSLAKSMFVVAALWATQRSAVANDGTGEAGFDPTQFDDKDGSKAANGFKSILGPDGVRAGQVYSQQQADLANAQRQQNVWDAAAGIETNALSAIGMAATRQTVLTAMFGQETADQTGTAIDAAEAAKELKESYDEGGVSSLNNNVGAVVSKAAEVGIDQSFGKAVPGIPAGAIAVNGVTGVFAAAAANLASYAIGQQYSNARPQVSK